MVRFLVGSVACVLFVCGCVSSQYMVVGDATYPPRPKDHPIEILLPVEAPVSVHRAAPNAKIMEGVVPEQWVLIGRVDTQGASGASWRDVFRDAMAKARTLGGDAIVLEGWGQHVTSVDSYGDPYYGKNISMKVYRLRD